MSKRSILGVFKDPETTVGAADALREGGFTDKDYEILTGAPYPEGAFGEKIAGHRLFIFPIIGALCGLAVGLLLTAGTQLAYPLVTGGKPILAIPPMIVVMYEGTLLGAILFTVMGIIFESRLPRLRLDPYDPRITEGYIGVVVSCPEERLAAVEQIFKKANATDIVHGRGRASVR